MSIVRGEAVLLKFNNGTDFVPFACARSITLNLKSDFAGKSTIGSGDWKEKEVTALDWNFSIEGAMYLDKPGFYDIGNIIQLWLSKVAIQISFFITDTNGTQVMMWGNALIVSVSPSGTVNNAGAATITGEGTGQLSSSTSFRICGEEPDTPTPGDTTLTFCFDSVDGATAYTIRIRDITAVTTTNDTAGAAPREEVVDSTHEYAFSLKWEPDGEFGPEIFWSDVS